MNVAETVIALHIARVMKGEGEIEAEGTLARFTSPRAPVLSGPLAWRVRVAKAGDEIWLDGWLKGAALVECARCLEPVLNEVDTRFQALLLHRNGAHDLTLEYGEDDDQERYVFGSPHVDLTALATEFFELAMPAASLCSPACPGLDPATGERRQPGQKDRGETSDDPRWKALEELDLPGE